MPRVNLSGEADWRDTANVVTRAIAEQDNGAVVRASGMYTKRNGLLKEARLG